MMNDQPKQGITLLYRAQLPGQPGPVFARLLNDLGSCGHAITTAELRDGEIHVALDGHAFTLGIGARSDTLGGARSFCRPQGDFMSLPAGRLGHVLMRHRGLMHLRFEPECPDGPLAAMLAVLCAQHRPDAVLWHPGGLALTASELLRTPLSALRALDPGNVLPRPLPRYDRPGALPEAASRSVFAYHRARIRPPAPAVPPPATPPRVVADIDPDTADAADPARTQNAGQSLSYRSVFGQSAAAPPAGLPCAIQQAQTLASTLRAKTAAANDTSSPCTGPYTTRGHAPVCASSRGIGVIQSDPICDALTLHGRHGKKRTVGTVLLALSMFSGMAQLLMHRAALGSVLF